MPEFQLLGIAFSRDIADETGRLPEPENESVTLGALTRAAQA
jgi:hypothetical protein